MPEFDLSVWDGEETVSLTRPQVILLGLLLSMFVGTEDVEGITEEVLDDLRTDEMWKVAAGELNLKLRVAMDSMKDRGEWKNADL